MTVRMRKVLAMPWSFVTIACRWFVDHGGGDDDDDDDDDDNDDDGDDDDFFINDKHTGTNYNVKPDTTHNIVYTLLTT